MKNRILSVLGIVAAIGEIAKIVSTVMGSDKDTEMADDDLDENQG